MQEEIFRLDIDTLKCGVNFVNNGNLIIYRGEDQVFRAARNTCRHQRGRFVQKESGPCITCPHHGWVLNAKTMSYENPAGHIKQPELKVRINEDQSLSLLEGIASSSHWASPIGERSKLAPMEFSLRFYAHACARISCGDKILFTDPWLTGPAFSRGWWLLHKAPIGWQEDIANADAIYISHNHSDHLNRHSLKEIAALNRDVPFYIPAFKNNDCERQLVDLGFRNVNTIGFRTWVEFGEHGRFMILEDAAGRMDSGLLVEYKGYRILNNVDCQNLENGHLAQTDVFMSSFAGGSSGFPVCWSDQYPLEEIKKKIAKSRLKSRALVAELAKACRARMFIPFAGYFVEAHPDDADIRELNWKNSPEIICETVKRENPGIKCWVPRAGASIDLSSFEAKQVKDSRVTDYHFDYYTREYEPSEKAFRALTDLEQVKEYFEWANFEGDLVLHVMETDDQFDRCIREFFYDFASHKLIDERPNTDHRYLRMKVRSGPFRHTLFYGLPWEELSIGFQCRFYREPDQYNFDFWDHFQNELPRTRPFSECSSYDARSGESRAW